MTDLAVQPTHTVHPLTGEMVDLEAAPDDVLARFLADVREYESQLREAKKLVSREVLRRMDTQASWQLRAGEYTMKGASPAPSEAWDELALRSDLADLVDEGVISVEAMDAAVETIVTYKVRRSGVNALRKLGGRVAEIVNRHCRQVDKDRYVTVGRVS